MIDDTNRLQFIGVDTHTRQTLKRFKEIVSDEIEPILKRTAKALIAKQPKTG